MCPFYFNIPRTSTFCFSTTFLTYLLCNFIRGQNALRIVLREGVKKTYSYSCRHVRNFLTTLAPTAKPFFCGHRQFFFKSLLDMHINRFRMV